MKSGIRALLLTWLCTLGFIACAGGETRSEVQTETLTGSLLVTAADANASFERPDSGIDWGTGLPGKNDPCTGTGAYESISLTVEDQSDEILGAATIEGEGTITDSGTKPISGGRLQFFATCQFEFDITDIPSDRTFYVVSADTERLTLSKEELDEEDWHVELRVSDI